jgi:hypothetical protein
VAATTPDPAAAVTAARSVLGDDSRARVSVRRPAAVGRQAVVEIRLDKPLVTPLLGGFTVPLRARAVMRVEQ